MESTDYLDVIRFPVTLLKLCGCYVPSLPEKKTEKMSNSKRLSLCGSLYFTYRVVIALIHLADMVRSLSFEVYCIQDFNTSMAYYVQWYIFLYFGSTAYIIEFFVTRRYFQPLLGMLQRYSLDFGFLGNVKKLKRYIRCLFLVLLIVSFLFNLLLTTAYLFWIQNKTPYFIYPFHKSAGVSQIIISYVTLIITTLIYQTSCAYFVLYTALIEIVSLEFRSTQKEMSEALRIEASSQNREEAFFRVRDRYRYLNDVVNKLTLLTRFYAMATFMYTLAIVLFVLFVLGGEGLDAEETFTEIAFLGIGLFLIAFICIRWGTLPGSANAITESIRTSNLNKESPKFLQQVQLFLTEVSTTKTGIDLFGLFTIDSSTILMLFGTVLTYGIIVIQTQQDTSKHCQCHCNTTCV
ncbi:hypothetical protein BgiMline_015711 [Biomphalaria glabrata]|nr:hypothetical protein BgiMline_008524 [Biomphalaria glabrata]